MAKVVRCGFEKGDDPCRGDRDHWGRGKFTIVADGEGEIRAEISVPGRHMVSNALLAAAVGLHCGLSLEQMACGLAAAKLTGGRLQSKQIGGVDFIDDSYNANPDSMRAAVQTLLGMACDGRRIAVLGGMAELGEFADEEHRKLGEERWPQVSIPSSR